MSETSTIGRLTAFGVDKDRPHKALMIAPNRYEDLRQCITSLNDLPPHEEEVTALIAGFVSKTPQYDPIKKRSTMNVRLQHGGDHLTVMAFGNPKQLPKAWQEMNHPVCMLGKVVNKPGRNGNSFTMMFGPKPIPEHAIGKAIGIYPQKSGVIGADKVRERILELITPENIRELLADTEQALSPHTPKALLRAWGDIHDIQGMDKTNLARVIYRMHHPRTPGQGMMAKKLLQDLDAVAAILAAERERPTIGVFHRIEHDPSKLMERVTQMSHFPTEEQLNAMQDALGDMASGQPMHRLLSGDTGTGKTTVFALVAAAVVDAGGSVGIMLPSADLVNQVATDIHHWWPDIPLERVTGKSAPDRTKDNVPGIKLGTTALLHRYGDWRPTLTIVDEQQKYSIEQRQQLSAGGGHLLEATATCMPRTLAQIQFGLIPVSRLTKAHTPKNVVTTMFDAVQKEDRQTLYQALMETLNEDGQTLVVFAARDAKEANQLTSVDQTEDELDEGGSASKPAPKVIPLETGFQTWAGAAGEGEVVALHGKMKPKERKASLDAMQDGTAKVLCATVSAEVGLNIPNLKQVIIYNAERFGLTQLHQLRGRVARLGGEGRCDLFVDKANLTDKGLDRLNALCQSQDGFRLAELDMQQRGIGELVSQNNRQSGASAGSLLVNNKLTLEHFENAQRLLDAVSSADATPTLAPGNDTTKAATATAPSAHAKPPTM